MDHMVRCLPDLERAIQAGLLQKREWWVPWYKNSLSAGNADKYEISAPCDMNDFARSRSKTELVLLEYLTATLSSVVVDMGATSVPPWERNSC
mmetsp:Transcript_30784/g.50912  ORF Transcript_30784/g.50912 Transcript_30784/m.50912 type:complete len:93 (-) Transcript_30784:424-702(-)